MTHQGNQGEPSGRAPGPCHPHCQGTEPSVYYMEDKGFSMTSLVGRGSSNIKKLKKISFTYVSPAPETSMGTWGPQ